MAPEAVRLWEKIEAIEPAFAGIGYLPLSDTVHAEVDAKLWERRELYFWCMLGAEGGVSLKCGPFSAAAWL